MIGPESAACSALGKRPDYTDEPEPAETAYACSVSPLYSSYAPQTRPLQHTPSPECSSRIFHITVATASSVPDLTCLLPSAFHLLRSCYFRTLHLPSTIATPFGASQPRLPSNPISRHQPPTASTLIIGSLHPRLPTPITTDDAVAPTAHHERRRTRADAL